MRPEDILERDFMVGLRGYDKDEVRSFLAEIAADHSEVLTELEALRAAPPVEAAPIEAAAPATDEFENLGASVAAILRAAKESSGEITEAAEAQATSMREAAESHATSVREAAEAQATEVREAADRYADGVRRQADEARASAQGIVDEARTQADAILREATERVAQLELEAEARVATKLEEAHRRAIALRASLTAASEEVQLALVALDDPSIVDVREPADEQASGFVG
jgi:DivIVA domain-containing protein